MINNSRMNLGMHSSYGNMVIMEFVINCNAASGDVNKGHYTSWASSKRLEVRCRSHNTSSHDSYIHWNQWWNGGTNSDASLIYVPTLKITAIA